MPPMAKLGKPLQSLILVSVIPRLEKKLRQVCQISPLGGIRQETIQPTTREPQGTRIAPSVGAGSGRKLLILKLVATIVCPT